MQLQIGSQSTVRNTLIGSKETVHLGKISVNYASGNAEVWSYSELISNPMITEEYLLSDCSYLVSEKKRKKKTL
jgi:hypothetical protein